MIGTKDIITFIHGGSYSSTKPIKNIAGFPYGFSRNEVLSIPDSVSSDCICPNNFGITNNGVDISHEYMCPTTSSFVSIPTNTKQIKVILIGAGSGGQGGEGKKMYTINGKQELGIGFKNGNNGICGEVVCRTINIVPNVYSYTYTIGKGSKGTARGPNSNNSNGNLGSTSEAGGDTTFTYNNLIYTAKGGSIDLEFPNITYTNPQSNNGIGGNGGSAFSESSDGNNGGFRIFFVY